VAAGIAVEARGEEEGRKRKFGPIWMIPHLVKGLRFLQTKILQVRETEDRQTLFNLCCGSALISMGSGSSILGQCKADPDPVPVF
jgi:hypothetical protein